MGSNIETNRKFDFLRSYSTWVGLMSENNLI